jgi:hypothetical protein
MENLTVLEKEIFASAQEIKSIEISVITDNDSYILAGDMLARCKRVLDAIDGRRVALKAPVLAEGKRIDVAFRPLIDLAGGLKIKLETGMKQWARELADAKEAWIKKQREEEQAKMKAESERLLNVAAENENTLAGEMALGMATNIEEQRIKDEAMVVKAKVQTLGGETKMTATKTWKFEIVVASAVPREYCEPAESLIRKAVASGVREIPGVKIYEDIKFINR